MKNIYEINPFFAVDFCGNNFSTMLAPGLSVTYRVKFMPERKEDYHYQLKFATDIGDVIIPVVGEIYIYISIENFELDIRRKKLEEIKLTITI